VLTLLFVWAIAASISQRCTPVEDDILRNDIESATIAGLLEIMFKGAAKTAATSSSVTVAVGCFFKIPKII
jgi:uncharacterized protein YqgC (DUF456 family)